MARDIWPELLNEMRRRTLVMGILNITPDSFSDGGKFFDPKSAVAHARKMASEGADIIDIGGLSTRPGSEPVSIEEELRRAIPVIEAVSKEIPIPISIDTYRSDVARAAMEAGASIINDISGLRFDAKMAPLAARTKSPVIIMHIKGTPREMQKDPSYEALIPEIMDYLRESIGLGLNAGIEKDRIVIDPGIGFGKTFDHNLEIIKNLNEFALMGYPVLVGPSRKAFIGHVLGGASPDERLEGTIAAVVASVLNGASIVRVHDVKECVKAVKLADAIKRGRAASGKE